MTADAPSAVSADESPEPAASAGERGVDAERAADPAGRFSYVPPADGGSPNGNGARTRDRHTAGRRRTASTSEEAGDGSADRPAVEEAPDEPSVDAPSDARTADARTSDARTSDAPSDARTADARTADARTADAPSDARTADAPSADAPSADATQAGPKEAGDDSRPAASADGHGARRPAVAVSPGRGDRGAVDDSGWEAGDGVVLEDVVLEDVVPEDVVQAEVAQQLGSVIGDDSDADPAEFAAAAVLHVLRASGWADAAEAAELRSEAIRLRELLAEVIRDHRAREASLAGFENQQLYWLVPLLRAAHGVAFGSLGAKVALRTAVQEVPPHVLASAGLRIDYGVEPDYGADHEDER